MRVTRRSAGTSASTGSASLAASPRNTPGYRAAAACRARRSRAGDAAPAACRRDRAPCPAGRYRRHIRRSGRCRSGRTRGRSNWAARAGPADRKTAPARRPANLQHAIRHRLAVAVEHPALDANAFARGVGGNEVVGEGVVPVVLAVRRQPIFEKRADGLRRRDRLFSMLPCTISSPSAWHCGRAAQC